VRRRGRGQHPLWRCSITFGHVPSSLKTRVVSGRVGRVDNAPRKTDENPENATASQTRAESAPGSSAAASGTASEGAQEVVDSVGRPDCRRSWRVFFEGSDCAGADGRGRGRGPGGGEYDTSDAGDSGADDSIVGDDGSGALCFADRPPVAGRSWRRNVGFEFWRRRGAWRDGGDDIVGWWWRRR